MVQSPLMSSQDISRLSALGHGETGQNSLCLSTAWADFMPSIKNATTLKLPTLEDVCTVNQKTTDFGWGFSSNSFRWRKMQVSHASTQPWRPDLLHSPISRLGTIPFCGDPTSLSISNGGDSRQPPEMTVAVVL